jgi:hypothetical protein
MAVKTYSAPRRRNVTPTSSILRIVTRDVDCSALTYTPEDGEFVVTAGDAATRPLTGGGAGDILFHAAGGNNADLAADVVGSSIKMVWSSALQTDRQALGNTKVPVLWLGGVEVECQLYQVDAATLASGFPAGTLVSIGLNIESVQGSGAKQRYVIEPMAENDCGWAVGYVTKSGSSNSAGTDAPANGKAITIMLYDQPRKVGEFA